MYVDVLLLPGRIVNFNEGVISPVRPLHVQLVLHAVVKRGLCLAAVLEQQLPARLLQAHRVLGELSRTRTFHLHQGR